MTEPMYNFCTLFDSNYLSRGLAMYESLAKQCDNFHLYVFTFDDISHQILGELNKEHITLITLKEFENTTSELLQTKEDLTIRYENALTEIKALKTKINMLERS